MRIIVTHTSPDLDAITSVWLIRKFLPGWEDAIVKFVPAGEKLRRLSVFSSQLSDVSQSVNQLTGKPRTDKLGSDNRQQKTDNRNPIERFGNDELIHVDTGLGPLDHHQTADDNVCGASLTFDFVKRVQNAKFNPSTSLRAGVQSSEKWRDRMEAVSRMVKVVVDTDHFKEVFWPNPTADYYEFSVGAMLDGLKLAKPNQDEYYVGFVSECLDAILHDFENRIWAEKEIATNGHKFETRFGKGIGFETINDSVIKLSQKTGYVIVVRKDPRKGYVRIKALPDKARGPVAPSSHPMSSVASSLRALDGTPSSRATPRSKENIDLTLAYEKLKKMDPGATWFLHIGKKMLLNGSVKNPKMRPTRLRLGEIIKVLEGI